MSEWVELNGIRWTHPGCVPGDTGMIGRKGGVVVVQEIFGVNAHIRSVCDRYADAEGYEAAGASAVRPHVRPSVELKL